MGDLSKLEIAEADYADPKHATDIIYLLDAYAKDQMGGSKPLSPYTKENLAKELSRLPHAFTLIAYLDDKPAGIANCFETLSTFACKPLVNIHDIAVIKEFRGHGIAQKLLEKIEEIAKAKGCCKITLEVLSGNKPAQNAYKKFGFDSYQLDAETGVALFWEKRVG